MLTSEVSKEKSTNVRIIIFRSFNRVLSRLAPGIAAKLAERIFITPLPTRRPSRELAWAENAQRTTIPSALGPIPVWSWGEGAATVILVHGWSGRGLQLGAFIEPLVKRGYRVVTHDAPGHGDARGRTSSMPAFAAALGAVARRFGPVQAVIAHSLGTTATVYALSQRELHAARIVAIAPSTRLHALGERFGDMAGFSGPVIDHMRSGLKQRFGFEWEASEPLRIAPSMPMPLAVIHDSADRFIPHSEGSDLAEAWPDGRLISTSNLGHYRILRDPDVIDSAVSFIAETSNSYLERRAS